MCYECDEKRKNEYMINSPDQIIKGCCDLQDGFYCIWDLNHMALACEEWVELCELYNIIRQISHIAFNVVAERARARNTLNNMRRDSPFSECKRFPWRKTYVNISCSVYGTVFQNLLGALDYKDRETEKEMRYGANHKQDDANQTNSASSSIDDAKTSFRNNLKNLMNELCKKNEIYDRIKFETKYVLKWCVGPCPTEPNVPGTTPPPNNPPPNVPPPNVPPQPPPGNQRFTYGNLMDALKARGLDPDSFNVFTESDMIQNRFMCNRDLVRLSSTLSDKLLPAGAANIYVFTTGEYSKCTDTLDPTNGYFYRGTTGILSEEMALRPTVYTEAYNDYDKFIGKVDVAGIVREMFDKHIQERNAREERIERKVFQNSSSSNWRGKQRSYDNRSVSRSRSHSRHSHMSSGERI